MQISKSWWGNRPSSEKQTKSDSVVLFFKSQWLEEEGFDLHASECKTRLWAACLLRRQFPKHDLLAANLTGLASKFTRGQQQPKRLLKFVFWSTQAAFLAAIKHKRMHLQRKNKIICLVRGSAALVVNGLLTHPVNLPCLLPHKHTTVSGLVVLMLNELVLHVPTLW